MCDVHSPETTTTLQHHSHPPPQHSLSITATQERGELVEGHADSISHRVV